MKEFELDLTGTERRSQMVAQVTALIDYPGWEGKNMSDWLMTVTAHQGLVPHLRSDADERFSIRVVNSSNVKNSIIVQLVRWVVRVNRKATELNLQPPLALSIE